MNLKDEEMIDQFLTDISAEEQDNPSGQESGQNGQDGSQFALATPHQQDTESQQDEQQEEQLEDTRELPSVHLKYLGTRKKCNDLSASKKWAIVARYMEEENRKSDRLYTGSLPKLCEEFSVSKRTIQRVVWEYKTQIEKGIRVPDMTNKKVGRGVSAKFLDEIADNIKKLKDKNLAEDKEPITVRGLADLYEKEYGQKISYMTLYRYDKRMNRISDQPSQSQSQSQDPSQHMPMSPSHASSSSNGYTFGGGDNLSLAEQGAADYLHPHQTHSCTASTAALPVTPTQQVQMSQQPVLHHVGPEQLEL